MIGRLMIGIALAMIASVSLAGTFIGLNNPDMKQKWLCASQSFSADGQTVYGVCQLTVPAVGRYVQSARYQYATTWDVNTGAVTLGAQTCFSPQHIGVDHSGCPQMVSLLDTNVVIQLDGVSFWYASTSVNGDILLTSSLVWRP